MVNKDLNKDDLNKIEKARKIYNENSINKLLSDKEENKLRKEKLDKIDGQENK